MTVIQVRTFSPANFTVTTLFCVVLNLGISALCIVITYLMDLNSRNQYVFIQNIEIRLEKVSNILSYLLPEFVKKRVKDGIRYIAEDKGTVSVIFCDIYNFDRIIADYSPNELIHFLDDVFSKFDKLCESVGVTKIETVGKTYLACAGLKDSELEMNSSFTDVPHARRAIELGLALLKEASKILLKNGDHLKLKIGINTGPVTAGVVGFHKPQFSLVGDTVNTASRMSSTLEEYDAIQISFDTYLLIGDSQGLSFTCRNPEVKGKGRMKTMIVETIQKYSEADDFIAQDHYSPIKKTSSSDQMTGNMTVAIDSSMNDSDIRDSHNVPAMLEKKSKKLKEDQKIGIKNQVLSFCKETEAEKVFQKNLNKHYYSTEHSGLLISGVCNFFLIFLECLQLGLNLDYKSVLRLVTEIIEELATIGLLLMLKKKFQKK